MLNDVEAALSALARRGQFVREAGQLAWPDGTIGSRFGFLHVLYRDVLYQRVPVGRRADLHRRVGLREEAAYADRAPEIAAELAMHFERSGELTRAGTYLQHAAENARQRSAYAEAQTHFERAVALLGHEPPSAERSGRELTLQIGRGAVIMAARGWSAPEAENAYSRARQLSHELGDTPHLFPALWGLWLYYWGRGPLSTAHELVRELLELARRDGGDAPVLQAHHAAWATAHGQGDLAAVNVHAAHGIDLYKTDRHAGLAATYGSHDAGICCRNFLSWALALQGRIAEAVRANAEAVALGRRLEHPFSLALAHFFAAATAQTHRNRQAVREHAAAALGIARQQDFRLVLAWALMLEGWAAVEEGLIREGIEHIDNALAEERATGANQFLPYFLGLKGEAHLKHGQTAAGLTAIDDALALVRATDERFWEAELYRLRGELLIAASAPRTSQDAEEALLHALTIARGQRAHLLTLRAAVSLAKVWQRAGRIAEARELVGEASRAISEGGPLPDLLDATAFLSACS
jgi:predicted ATPase